MLQSQSYAEVDWSKHSWRFFTISNLVDGEPKADASPIEAAAHRLRLNPDQANSFQEIFRANRFVPAPEGEPVALEPGLSLEETLDILAHQARLILVEDDTVPIVCGLREGDVLHAAMRYYDDLRDYRLMRNRTCHSCRRPRAGRSGMGL